MKYFIQIYEVHVAHVEIESDKELSRAEIIQAAEDKDKFPQDDDFVYDYTLDPEDWIVINENGDKIEVE